MSYPTLKKTKLTSCKSVGLPNMGGVFILVVGELIYIVIYSNSLFIWDVGIL